MALMWLAAGFAILVTLAIVFSVLREALAFLAK